MNKGIGCQRFKASSADKRLWKNWERRQATKHIDHGKERLKRAVVAELRGCRV